jgi:hypothetical protein
VRALLFALLVGCVREPETPRPSVIVNARVQFTNKIGSSFVLRRLSIRVDSLQVASRADDNLAAERDLTIAQLRISSGEHEIFVEADFQGNGYGVFSYLKGYKFKVRAHQPFEIDTSSARDIHCTAYEQGGPTTPLEERPQIRCQITEVYS